LIKINSRVKLTMPVRMSAEFSETIEARKIKHTGSRDISAEQRPQSA